MKKRILAWLLAVALLLGGCGIVADGNKEQPCDSHTDANYNGECDWCGHSVMTTVDFYTVNDLHGKVADGENHPGVDELTTFFKNAHETDDNVVILSAGDMWQGSSESNLTHGLLMTDWMNRVGFVAMTLGNHEYDWGESYIEENQAFAEFPFLAINIYERATNEPVDYCRPSVVVEADGIQIGIIGAMGDCYSSIAADKVEDVYFKTGAALTALVKEESDRLRSEGVDFIVYVLHDGYGRSAGSTATTVAPSQMASYYDVALSDGYVDLVFEGHTHQQYLIMDQYGVYHLQNRGDNKGGISHVEVEFNTVTGSFNVRQKELIRTDSYERLPDDSIVDELLDKYEDQVSVGNQIVGRNARKRNGDYLCQTAADLYYQVGMERWGSAYPIVLGGGYLNVRSPYSLAAGDVKYSQLQSLFPFDNDLVLCSVSGRDLLDKFINSKHDSYFICGDAQRMKDVDPAGTYYIVVDTYTSSYAPNRLTVVEEYTSGVYARDLLADYIGKGGME
ncbi:MAG: metallophosphoesterase [Oscillospiraceae bacterium]|nr:metallophosphoesterase [Oscillospiraceae bacterium]